MKRALFFLVAVMAIATLAWAASEHGPLGSYPVASGTSDGYIVFPTHTPYSYFRVLIPDNDTLIRFSVKGQNIDNAEWLTLPASNEIREFYVPYADSLQYDRTAATAITVWAEVDRR